MRFEWDERKSVLNKKKHGLSFEVAAEVFADPFCIAIPDRIVQANQREWSIGRLRNLVVAVVVHTSRDADGEEVIRIISARKATPLERNTYEEAER